MINLKKYAAAFAIIFAFSFNQTASAGEEDQKKEIITKLKELRFDMSVKGDFLLDDMVVERKVIIGKLEKFRSEIDVIYEVVVEGKVRGHIYDAKSALYEGKKLVKAGHRLKRLMRAEGGKALKLAAENLTKAITLLETNSPLKRITVAISEIRKLSEKEQKKVAEMLEKFLLKQK